MTAASLRVALVSPERAEEASALAEALAALGHRPAIVTGTSVPAVDATLARRGFTGPLTPLPRVHAAVLRGGFDVVHAFSAPGALAGRLWRRRSGRPVVFTCTETLDRASVADTRLRLALLASAVERSDALLAPDEARAEALQRWMARRAEVVAAADAAAHVRVYRAALDRRPR